MPPPRRARRAALGCTQTELDRWDADGRLRHLFVRKLQFERATVCRFWDAASVAEAAEKVAAWRKQDKTRTTCRRRGLRVA